MGSEMCIRDRVKAKAYREHRDALIALVASDKFRDAAQDYIQRYGAAAHVLILVKQFGENGVDLVARESQVDRLRARPGLVAGPRASRVMLVCQLGEVATPDSHGARGKIKI